MMMRPLFESLPLKLMSLAFAFLLWLLIAGERTSEMGMTVAVELQNFPRELELTGEPVNAVEVRLRASPGMIQRIVPGEVSAQVNLVGFGAGEHIVHLTEDSIRMPFGVKVVKISPAVLTFHLERTLRKVVPIQPRLLGRPAEGFEVAEVTSEPAEVRLEGPTSRVDEVESAFTEPVSVDGARDTVTETVTIGIADPLLRVLVTPRVRVTARVREQHDTRVIKGVAVEVRGGAAEIRPQRVDVTLTGPAASLPALASTDLRAYADPARIVDGRIPVTVEIGSGHAGVEVKEVSPTHVVLRAEAPAGVR
jgi:YbbR domain-containing protein